MKYRALLLGCTVSLSACMSQPLKHEALNGQWQIYETSNPAFKSIKNANLAFSNASEVFGTTGCNRFRGGYTLGDQQLNFGTLGVTRRLCQELLNKQERAILDAFEHTHSAEIKDQRLILKNAQGEALLRAKKAN